MNRQKVKVQGQSGIHRAGKCTFWPCKHNILKICGLNFAKTYKNWHRQIGHFIVLMYLVFLYLVILIVFVHRVFVFMYILRFYGSCCVSWINGWMACIDMHFRCTIQNVRLDKRFTAWKSNVLSRLLGGTFPNLFNSPKKVSEATSGWPQNWETWNTQGFIWTRKTQRILRECCATSGKIVTNKVFLVCHSNICVQ